jgi:hypothetical protein
VGPGEDTSLPNQTMGAQACVVTVSLLCPPPLAATCWVRAAGAHSWA